MGRLGLTISYPVIVILLALTAMAAAVDEAGAVSPQQQLKRTIDRAVAVIENQDLNDDAKMGRLRQLIEPLLDSRAISQRVLARHYSKYAKREQEFTPLLMRLLQRAYVQRVWLEEGKGVRIEYLGQQLDGDTARVDTKVITAKGNEIPVSYRMGLGSAEWKVYDILVLGISLVNNYRTQFDKFLAKRSFDELLEYMRKKASEEVRR